MSPATPRIRMFAGPNGSGKSTLNEVIRPELLGVYINADEIEKTIASTNRFDLAPFGLAKKSDALQAFLETSSRLSDLKIHALEFNENGIHFNDTKATPYFASIVAEFIRSELIKTQASFTFETVMSHVSKVDLLRSAQNSGYRTYLYFVATEHPDINCSRVASRVREGGHSVPEDKIVSRYTRSLDLLMDAIRVTNRAFIFDK